MAVFYQLVSDIKRGTFTCAMATAAYRSGSHLQLEAVDPHKKVLARYSFDYSKKVGIALSAIMAPENAPDWIFDRQTLWQTVENQENKFNSHLAREYTIALPEELTPEQNIKLVTEFVKTSFVSRDMVADVNFHNDHSNNPHLHIMCPTRSLGKDRNNKMGFSMKRRDWHTKSVMNSIRQEQANVINKYLAQCGHESRVSHIPDKVSRFDCLRPWL
jgi:ATP-dependent exoDNAse (exonuclease V) alpha subunit